LDFDITEEQKGMVEAIRELLDRVADPSYLRRLDEEERYPQEVWDALAAAGWFGLPVANEYGGLGGNVLDVVLVVEELARRMTALGTMYLTSSCFGANSIGAYGNEEQKSSLLPKIARGELRFCFGVTEPNTGVDTLSLTTTAVQKGDEWVINGRKVFITGADVADYIVLLTRTKKDVAKRSQGLTIFMVPGQSEGVQVRPMKKLGLKAIHTCEVFLDDVRVSGSCVLGDVDRGWEFILHTMNNERITVSAYRIGNARAALEDAVTYAKETKRFGKPIGQFQAIQHRLAETYAMIDVARLAVYRAAWLQSQGRPCGREAAIAKYLASEVVVNATQTGMRVMAGYGYMMEYPMQRYYRDAILAPTGTATQELLLSFLGESLGLPKSY
jgi:alkylation response protein AidB-like acyl-CoA dehydrogenase